MNWFLFFEDLLKSVLFSTGGFGPLPSLHHDFLEQGWSGEKEFTEALTIGQVTPGPNGLWVVSLCYLTAGWIGVILSILALLLPPMFILLVEKGHEKIAHFPATQGILDGVVLVIVILNLIVLLGIFQHNGGGYLTLIIAVVSAVIAIFRLLSVNYLLLIVAILGLVL